MKYFNCGGNHVASCLECPMRVKENEVAKVRANQNISYAAAAERVEGANGPEGPMVVDSLQAAGVGSHQQDPDILQVKKVDFVLMAMVINGTAKVEKRSRKIDIIVDAAKRFLGLEDFSAMELHEKLSRAVLPRVRRYGTLKDGRSGSLFPFSRSLCITCYGESTTNHIHLKKTRPTGRAHPQKSRLPGYNTMARIHFLNSSLFSSPKGRKGHTIYKLFKHKKITIFGTNLGVCYWGESTGTPKCCEFWVLVSVFVFDKS